MYILMAVAIASTSCVNLEPKPDTTKLYTLGPVPAPDEGRAVSQVQGLYVASPDLPLFAIGNKLNYREADGELKSLPAVRWAESFDTGVARAMADYLNASGHVIVGYYPWPYLSTETPKLTLNFQEITAYADGRLQIAATWSLEKKGRQIGSGQFASEGVTWSVGNAASYVAGLNEGLKQLAGEIVSSL